MIQHLAIAVGLISGALGVAAAAAGAPNLAMRWEVELKAPGAAPCLYPDEESPDSVVVTDGNFLIRLDPKGKEVLRFDLGGPASAVPAIADLDGDGAADIVAGTADGSIIALTGGGKELWRRRLGAVYTDFKALVLADVTGDGRPEVIAADNDGWVNCLDRSGKLLWRFKTDPYRAGSPAVGDLDGDGRAEIVYGTDNHRVACISSDGRLRWQFRQKRNFGRSLPMIADLGSGPVALIHNSSPPFGCNVYCLDGATGRLAWESETFQQGYTALAVADLDGDGKPEVVSADKSSRVYAFTGDGKRLWATHLGGTGIFFAPAIADVDGDGALEIVAAVRASRADGRNLFLLTPKGKIKGEYSLPGSQATAPAVGDLDKDGVLEVVTCGSQPGEVRCFTFGGKARAGAVASACYRGSSDMSGSRLARGGAKPRAKPAREAAAPARYSGKLLAEPRVGTNEIMLPADIRVAGGLPQQPVVEVSCVWRGQRETRVFDFDRSTRGKVTVELLPGEQELDVALVDAATGRRMVVFAEGQKVSARAVQRMEEAEGAGALAVALADQRAELESLLQSAKTKTLDVAARRELIEAADALSETMHRAAAFKRFKAAMQAAGWSGSFAAWQDDNPWDDGEPIAELPARPPAQPAVEVWALGNEHEHAAINVIALGDRPVTVRATLKGLESNIEMLRPVWLPSKWGGRVPDVLPKLGSSGLLDVIPGEPCQLWLNFDTKGLEPGSHEATLTLTSLEEKPSILAVKVKLEVSPVALPDQPRTRVCCWRRVLPDGSGGLDDRVWADLKAHGVTVVYGPSPPGRKCDEKGDLAGEADWSGFDGPAKRLVDEGAFLFVTGFPVSGPVKEWSPEWVRAVQAAAGEFDAHLHLLGIGNDRWAYYPVDEPCLVGGELVERFIRYASTIKKAHPQILVYADPAGAVTTDFLQRMSPYCDVWTPELSVLKQGPPEWLEIMRKNGVQVWCYEAPGDVRVLKPLGFYRMQPWVAARYGLDGSGYWVYQYDDLWGVGDKEPAYGAAQIEPDQSITTTRRWEASRDGIEDSTLLHLLQDAIASAEAKGKDASAARALRKEAVDAIAASQDEIDAFTRWLIDYEMDFGAVQRYRRQVADQILRLKG